MRPLRQGAAFPYNQRVIVVRAQVINDSAGSMKSKKVSLWRSISDAVRHDIERGALKGGERIPTDIELAQRFGCNKHTARRAISHLEQEGLVRVEWGRGTFVVERTSEQHSDPQGHILHSLLDQHRNLPHENLRAETTPATAAVARALRITVGSPCLHVALLRESGDIPLSIGINFFPLKRLPRLADSIEQVLAKERLTSVGSVLKLAGVHAHRCTRIRIGARLPTAEEAVQLRVARQQPLLEIESVDVDDRDRPVLYSKTCFRADRLQFVIPVG